MCKGKRGDFADVRLRVSAYDNTKRLTGKCQIRLRGGDENVKKTQKV